MKLFNIPRSGPEISDAIVAFDPETLQRRPVIKSECAFVHFDFFTLVRPLVVLAGMAWGILAAPGPATILLGLLVVILMLGLGRVISAPRESTK